MFDRRTMIRRLESESFDVLVVGGGIVGVGCALDAATRGLRVALVERDDFGSGTSSKSSKLVHGGLRYLQQREFRLVYEALHERQRLRKIAPHQVRMLPFMIPILTADGVVSPRVARALGSALWMYDLTGGWRIGKFHKKLSPKEAMAHLPSMPAGNVAGAYMYFDAEVDDARLCLTIVRTAAAHGAVAVNRSCVSRFTNDPMGRVNGAFVSIDGRDVEVRARAVINATGVWSDTIRRLDDPGYAPTIRPAKGIHITVPTRRIGADTAVVIPVRADKRSMFIIPNGDFTFVGTTDTDYAGPIDDPQCTSADIDYVLTALNEAITTDVTRDDIVGTWAGLRPLVKGAAKARTADLSRRHTVSMSSSGVVTVTGGKLTTYRKMADDAVSMVCKQLDVKARCVTNRRKLLGAAGYVEPTGAGVDAHLLRRYGTEAAMLRALIVADRSLADPLVPGLPYVRAEAVHACRHEMATSIDDLLSRRTRARLLGAGASWAAADDVALLMAPLLGWSEVERTRQVDAYRASVAHEQAWRD